MIFAHSKTWARTKILPLGYVKIMITNHDLAFHHEIFQIYSILSSKFIYSVELSSRTVKLHDHLTFSRKQKCSYRNLPQCKNYMSAKWYQENIKFYIYCECSVCLPRLQLKPSVSLETHQLPALAFLLSIKKRTDVMSACFYSSKLCSFGYYQKNNE